jgi:hypothetical protein
MFTLTACIVVTTQALSAATSPDAPHARQNCAAPPRLPAAPTLCYPYGSPDSPFALPHRSTA